MPHPTTDTQIRARVDQFVTELSGLIREAALEAVGEALGRSGLASPVPRRASKKKAGRRQPASSGADLSEPVLAHVRANPGSRAEQITTALGANNEDVKKALARLKAAGAVNARGQKRGTNYVAGAGGATRKAGKKKGARRKRTVRKTSSPAATA